MIDYILTASKTAAEVSKNARIIIISDLDDDHFPLPRHVRYLEYIGRPFWLQFHLQSAVQSAQSTVSSATGCRDIPMRGETVRGKCDISAGELRPYCRYTAATVCTTGTRQAANGTVWLLLV